MTGDPVLAAVGGLFGLLFGSFLNVCISRWPAGQSVIRPRSRCPKCGGGIPARDNIPVLSWILLRGKRRRHCGNPISAMYPLVELLTAAIWAWCAWRWGLGAETLKWALFGSILLGIAMTDAREFIIPHEFSFGGLVVGVVFGFAGGLGMGFGALSGAIFGAGLVYLLGMLGEFAFRKEAMGGGDVAMMAMVGSLLGWESVLATIFVGAAVGVVLHLASRVVGRSSAPSPRAERGGRTDAPPRSARGDETEGPPSTGEMTPDELRASGYLPFGVSLAIAAGLIALVTGPQPVIDWFANYASLLGM